MSSRRVVVLLAVLACAVVLTGCDLPPRGLSEGSEQEAPGAGAESSDAPGSRAESLLEEVSQAVCSLAFRCCDESSQELYLSFWSSNPLVAEQSSALPPSDEGTCRELVAEMMTVLPFGDWFRAVDYGLVELNEDAYAQCLARLEQASCGEEARSALFDSSCFGLAAPAGGTDQRSVFARNLSEGSCYPLNDGLGASFYGTCDPHSSFCCYGEPDCGFPYGDNQVPREGSCIAASGPGELCSTTPPIQLCSTGLYCDSGTGSCVAPETGPIGVGQPCVDESWNLSGSCVDSYCDVLGSQLCEELKENGEACQFAQECRSGACEETCTPSVVCSGR